MTDPLPDAAALIGLDLPEACLTGVAAALEGLGEHLRILEDFEMPTEEG